MNRNRPILALLLLFTAVAPAAVVFDFRVTDRPVAVGADGRELAPLTAGNLNIRPEAVCTARFAVRPGIAGLSGRRGPGGAQHRRSMGRSAGIRHRQRFLLLHRRRGRVGARRDAPALVLGGEGRVSTSTPARA